MKPPPPVIPISNLKSIMKTQTYKTPRQRSPKPRPDSKLKNLPRQQQEQIIDWLAHYSYRDVINLVRKNLGVTVSIATLGVFRSWWLLGRHLQNLPALTRAVAASPLAAMDTEPDEIAEAIQIVFQLDALDKQDVNAFCRLRSLQQADQRFKTEEALLKAAHPTTPEVELTLRQQENLTRANFRLPLLPDPTLPPPDPVPNPNLTPNLTPNP